MKKDLQLLAQAMLNEIEGAEFYRLAAAKAPNEESKESLLELAEEEMRHFGSLKSLADKMANNETLTLEEVNEEDSPGIFDWGKTTGFDLELGVSIYSVAMQMELKSMNYYLEAQKKADDENIKKLMGLLADWEKEHYNQFERVYESYRNQWWGDMGFAPF